MKGKKRFLLGTCLFGLALIAVLGLLLIRGSGDMTAPESKSSPLQEGSLDTGEKIPRLNHPSLERVGIPPSAGNGPEAAEAKEKANASALFLELIAEIRALGDEALEKEYESCGRKELDRSLYSKRLNEIEKIHYQKSSTK